MELFHRSGHVLAHPSIRGQALSPRPLLSRHSPQNLRQTLAVEGSKRVRPDYKYERCIATFVVAALYERPPAVTERRYCAVRKTLCLCVSPVRVAVLRLDGNLNHAVAPLAK